VNVPGVRMVDAAEGILGIDWIDGNSVRKLLPGGGAGEDNEDVSDTEDEPEADAVDLLQEYQISVGMFHASFSPGISS
jgi:hypothetical protein